MQAPHAKEVPRVSHFRFFFEPIRGRSMRVTDSRQRGERFTKRFAVAFRSSDETKIALRLILCALTDTLQRMAARH
eukprot:5672623-Pyramimonas_sp.AAC.1